MDGDGKDDHDDNDNDDVDSDDGGDRDNDNDDDISPSLARLIDCMINIESFPSWQGDQIHSDIKFQKEFAFLYLADIEATFSGIASFFHNTM